MEKEKMVLVPVSWFERLLEINGYVKNDNIFNHNLTFLQGYIDSAKTIIKYNKKV